MVVLALDFMNMCHRARSGFTAGDHSVVFNFFRGFKALVEQFKPSRVYVALEGHPKHRHDALPTYKAQRVSPPDAFFAQVSAIQLLLSAYFPVSVVHHPDYEGDDTIANLVMRSSTAIDWVVASSDSDFTQLLTRPNIKLYNMVSKKFVATNIPWYVGWKALRGDASDNIPGFPGIGDKKAEVLIRDDAQLKAFLCDESKKELFLRNLSLIEFANWDDKTAASMTCSSPARDWENVKHAFDSYGFTSITAPKYWDKFVGTFDPLFG